MKCPECGAKIKRNSKVCFNCGSVLKKETNNKALSFLNYFFTTFLTFLFVSGIIFLLVYSSIRAYPHIYGPTNAQMLEGESWKEACIRLGYESNSSDVTLFTILLVFTYFNAIVAILYTCGSGPKLGGTVSRVDIGGKSYEVLKYGDGGYAISKGLGSSGFGSLGAAVVFALFIGYPSLVINTFFTFFKLIFSNKEREKYKEIYFRDYWSDYFHVGEGAGIIVSYIFIICFIILSTVVIIIS